MNPRGWFGLAVLIVSLALGYLRIRKDRRNRLTQSFGHPVLDNFLLLVSGCALAAILALAIYHLKLDLHPIARRAFGYTLLLVLAGGLSWFGNGILRRIGKRN